MKVFISQPMRGKTDEEILAVRKSVIAGIKSDFTDETIEIVDSFFEGTPADAKPLWFLGKAIEKLSTADIAVFVEGYEEARGCRIERECAYEYDIPSYVASNAGVITALTVLDSPFECTFNEKER